MAEKDQIKIPHMTCMKKLANSYSRFLSSGLVYSSAAYDENKNWLSYWNWWCCRRIGFVDVAQKIQVETYYSINIIYLILYMQEEAKLVVAEQFDQQKLEFIIFNNQVVGEGGFGIVKKAIRNDKPN